MNVSFICRRCLADRIKYVKHITRMLSRPLHISQKQGPMAIFHHTLGEKTSIHSIAFSSCDSLVNDIFVLKSQKALEAAKVMYSTCSRLESKVKWPLNLRSEKNHRYSNIVVDSCNKAFSTTHKLSNNLERDHTKQISGLNSSRKDSEETEKARSNIESEYFHFHSSCHPETRTAVMSSFEVIREYVSEDEETVLMKEVEPHLKRLKYEFDHWDDAIHGFRETERSRWGKVATNIICRMRQYAFPEDEQQLPQIHVLDLAKTGVIKPHVDSVRFCGNIICGLCLLSDAVMRLVHVENKDQVIDVILRRRSLYIMKDVSRYKYTHEVLGENESYFGTEPILRERRVSIMCRNRPGKYDKL